MRIIHSILLLMEVEVMELRMYTDKSKVPGNLRFVVSNDAEFLSISNMEIPNDDIGRKVIEDVEGGRYKDSISFYGKFGGDVVRSINLSTGSKTIINLYNSIGKDICINTNECGKNAMQFILDNLAGNIVLPLHLYMHIKERGVSYYVDGVKVSNDNEFRRAIVNARSKRFA